MNRLLVLTLVIAGCAWLLVRCTTPAATLRYRLTIEIDTPHGRETGSSVTQLTLRRKRLVPLPGVGGGDRGGGLEVRSRAPFIDPGEGRTLFVRWNDGNWPHHGRHILNLVVAGLRLPALREEEDDDAAIFRRPSGTRPTSLVPPDRWPMLATFRNTRYPASIREFLPGDLGTVLGPGYAVNRVVIEVVGRDEPPITALATRFPLLAKAKGLLSLPVS